MKKTISLCVSVFLIMSTLMMPAFATSNEDTVYVNIAPIIFSRSVSQTAEEYEYYVDLGVYYYVNGRLVSETERIYFEYAVLNVPNSANQVDAYKMLSEFSDRAIQGINGYQDNLYCEAVRRDDASALYNCHSYAWYSTSTDNCYWIDNPTNFYLGNNDYHEVTTPTVGDIICYFNGSYNIHSGIVTAVNGQVSNGKCGNSNTVEVISKWGTAGLYEHNGYECPYTQYGGGAATSVKYFHKHTFIYSVNGANESIHTVTCSACNYSYVDNHTYRSLPSGGSRCTKCGYTSSGQIIMSETPKPVEQ